MSRSGVEILRDLDTATKGLQAASQKLSQLHEGHFGVTFNEETGEVVMGTGLRYQTALEEEVDSIYSDAENAERRPPPADVREARAKKEVRRKNPQLWAEYQSEHSQMEALRLWISSAKANINGLQSLRKAEAP